MKAEILRHDNDSLFLVIMCVVEHKRKPRKTPHVCKNSKNVTPFHHRRSLIFAALAAHIHCVVGGHKTLLLLKP